jgi:hypothetical protein
VSAPTRVTMTIALVLSIDLSPNHGAK